MNKNALWSISLPLAFLTGWYVYLLDGKLSVLFAAAGLLLILFIVKLSAPLRFPFAWLGGMLIPWIINWILSLVYLLINLLKGPGYGMVLFRINWTFYYPLYGLLLAMGLFFDRGLRGKSSWMIFFLVLSIPLLQLAVPEAMNRPMEYTEVIVFLGLVFLLSCVLLLRPSGQDSLKGWLPLPLLLLILFVSLNLLAGLYQEKSVTRGGGLLEKDSFHFDFTDYLQLQPEVSMSDDLILLFRREGEAKRMLLRRIILAGFDKERGYFHSDPPESDKREYPPLRLPPSETRLQDPGFEGRSEVLQEFYLVNLQPDALISMNYPIEIQPFQHWDDSSFIALFHAKSQVYTEALWRLLSIREFEMDPKELEFYTQWDEREDIQALAEEITADSPRPFLQVIAIEQYLKENYYYSLKPGVSLKGDPLGHFLFDGKKGYCSYFAFAMTSLCRSLGIPARIALGFWVDPESEVMNFYPVLANQAHAWVEVYFNEYGWVEFDPTSNELAPGEDIHFGSIDPGEYRNLIQEILENNDQLKPRNLQQKELLSNSSVSLLEMLWKDQRILWGLSLFIIYLLLLFSQRSLFWALRPGNHEKRIKRLYCWLRRDAARCLVKYHPSGDRHLLPREWEARWGQDFPEISLIINSYQRCRFAASSERDSSESLWSWARGYRKTRRHRAGFLRSLAGQCYPLPQRRYP